MRAEKILCYFLAVLLTMICIETFFTGLFTCQPIAFFWDNTIPGGVCVDKMSLYFANAGLNIASDIAVLPAPAFILRHLTLPRVQKVMIGFILASGGLSVLP
jgi:hypothetical protein